MANTVTPETIHTAQRGDIVEFPQNIRLVYAGALIDGAHGLVDGNGTHYRFDPTEYRRSA